MSNELKEWGEQLMERHLPVAFLDCETLQQIKEILFAREHIGRKEILIFAYVIGATVSESNELLRMLGWPPLYVKRREDAIWRFMLNRQIDSATVINEIFLQNVGEFPDETAYN